GQQHVMNARFAASVWVQDNDIEPSR
ncbi:MAG: hypothetical protein ACI9OU_002513, partial [Candidatus Promineifilaceae bacterium]